jgi:hypothetical protein
MAEEPANATAPMNPFFSRSKFLRGPKKLSEYQVLPISTW